jgi:hypothetical protein
MNQKQRAKWERTRAKGMWRFVSLYGAVMSVCMIIATSLFDYFTSPYGLRLEQMKVRVPVFLISGLIAGVVIWFIGEYQYQKSSGSASLNQ